MGWRDGFTAKGSFKGSEFWLRDDELEAGRRAQVHEYPLRDKPYVEDLGRKARKYQIEAYLIGPDYQVPRDALIASLEESGSGTLVHPYYGRLTVTLAQPARISQSTREGGYARISMQFIEAGEQAFPTATVVTQNAVRQAADQSIDEAVAEFADTFEISDIAGAVDGFLDEVDSAFSSVSNIVGSVTGPLADIVRAPAELGASIAGSVTNISSIITEPLRAIRIYSNLFGAGSDPVYSNTSPRALQATRNTQAMNELVRTSAVVSAARSSADLELSPALQGDNPITRTAVLDLRDELLDAIDIRQQVTDIITGASIDDALYNSLADLRVAVMLDLSARGKRLPSVITYTPRATLPALLIAHRLYGDASRDGELINLNNIAHPGFVRGGVALEALSE